MFIGNPLFNLTTMVKFFIAALFFCSCNQLFLKKEKLRGLKISEVVPILSSEAKLLGYDTFNVKLYYTKQGYLCYLNYGFDSSHNEEHILSEERFHYVYYEPDSIYGYDFDIHKSPKIRKISMDSLRKREWIFRLDICNIFTKARVTLVSSKNDVQTNTLHEAYNFKGIQDTSMTGSCYLSFTKNLNNIPFSLCNVLDSAKKMKLHQINIVNNPRYFKTAGIYLERMESAYSIEEISISNPKEIQAYFKMLSKK